MGKLLEIPMTKDQFYKTKDAILKMGSAILTMPVQEFLNRIQKAEDFNDFPYDLELEEMFLLIAMARDLLRFKQSTKKLLEFYEEQSQVDAVKVEKAHIPKDAKQIIPNSGAFDDDDSDF